MRCLISRESGRRGGGAVVESFQMLCMPKVIEGLEFRLELLMLSFVCLVKFSTEYFQSLWASRV